MPTYEYQCAKCDQVFELMQSMKDPALTVCPKDKCPRKVWGKGKVTRLIGTGAGLIFKGSGFYITDYRSEGYKASAKSDASAGETKKTETKSESPKTESKPAATPAEKPKATPTKD